MSELQIEEHIKQTITQINTQIDEYNGKLQIISNGILELKQGHAEVIQQHVESNTQQSEQFKQREEQLLARQKEVATAQEELTIGVQQKLQATKKTNERMNISIQDLIKTNEMLKSTNANDLQRVNEELQQKTKEILDQQQYLQKIQMETEQNNAALQKNTEESNRTYQEQINTLVQEKELLIKRIEELLGYITSNDEQVTLLYEKIPQSIGGPINTMMTNYFQKGGYNWRTPSSKTFRTMTNSKSMPSSSRRMSSKRSSKRITKKYKMKK
jgi:hypothetical protein